jgi:hypothetical protein
MNWNNILKNQTRQDNLNKNIYSKKACKTRDLSHETGIEPYKRN